MAQLVFNDSLSLLGIVNSGATTLTGTTDVTYGVDNTVSSITGSLSLTAVGVIAAQTYTNLNVSLTNVINGIPTYTITGSNTLTNIAINYSGQLPVSATATVNLLGTQLSLASGTGNVTSSGAICFARGTKILTERGEFAIEDLAVGDLVVTPHADSPTMEIRWIGRQRFEGGSAEGNQPILILEGALGQGLPHRDLRLSGDHCLYLDGRLVPAKLLVNGATIIAERGDAVIEYLNLELDRHTVVLAEGVESESYLDCGNRSRFDNALEPCDWLASRPLRDDRAWDDGSAFAVPLWGGPQLDALFSRLADGHSMIDRFARVA